MELTASKEVDFVIKIETGGVCLLRERMNGEKEESNDEGIERSIGLRMRIAVNMYIST